jgi:hypothetical protein
VVRIARAFAGSFAFTGAPSFVRKGGVFDFRRPSWKTSCQRKQNPSRWRSPPHQILLTRHPTPTARPTRATNRRTPRNHRELAEAIFEECDAVAIGRELLGPNNERASNGVKARIWETLVDFLFGKLATPGNTAAEPKVRIIWDLPSPPHEKDKP